MTTQTTTTTTTMVSTNAQEFVAFVMDKNTGMTVARVEAELDALGVVYRKKDKKEVKAQLWFDALQRQGAIAELKEEEAAAGETPVADTKQEESVNMEQKIAEIRATREAIKKSQGAAVLNIKKFREVESMRGGHGENANLLDMLAKVNAAKDRYLSRVGEHRITLESVEFYPEQDEATYADKKAKKVARIHKLANGTNMHILGEVVVQVPSGFMQIKRWDKNAVNSKGKLGAPVFMNFDGYDVNLTTGPYNMRQGLATGDNRLALNIMEFVSEDGTSEGLQVSLPREKGKDGRYWPIFKTNDIRMVKTSNAVELDEPLYTEDNNEQFNAQLTALVRLYAGEHVISNPMNNHAFNKTWCVNMVRFSTKDGVSDDLENASRKSRAILEQPDTMQSSTVGPEQPQRFCTVTEDWIDMEAVQVLNAADKQERTYGIDPVTGLERFQSANEIIWGGQLVEKNTVRDEITAKHCATCPFFCGNTPRDEKKVAAEKVQLREDGASDYVNSFYRERARAGSQAIQVLVGDEERAHDWVLASPGELTGGVIHELRVKSGALNVYASPDVLEHMMLDYVPPVEEFDAVTADFNKKVDWIFAAAFRPMELTEEQLTKVASLTQPEGISEYQVRRWNTAMEWLEKSKQWAVEREAQANTLPYYQHFFTGVVATRRVYFEHFEIADKTPFITRPVKAIELHIDDVMAEKLEKASHSDFDSMEDLMDLSGETYNARRNDYIHSVYDDLTEAEFVRHLDDNARNYVDDVIENNTYYTIVGGSERDKALAAGAMQELLQREMQWTWLKGIRRDENPLHALIEAQISEEAKAYIVEVLGLLN